MDVDKLFKLPSVPQSSVNKRKWADPSSAALKAARVEDVDEEEGQRNGRKAHVADLDSDVEQEVGPQRPPLDDDEDGAEFAPNNDADYFIEEDDEGGRFFGGGLTAQQKRILELMNQGRQLGADAGDGARDEDDEGLTPEQELKNLRRALVRLERAITKNQELRAKYSDDPQRFIESEADLHDAIRALVVVTTNPALLYPELVKQDSASSLCGLLTHENIDISASVVELLEEMTDDDVLDAGLEGRTREEQEEGTRRGQVAVEGVVEPLLQNSLVDLLIDTLPRLERDERAKNASADEQDSAVAQANAESDAAAIFHILGLVENLVSLRANLADTFLEHSKFRTWLLSRILPKAQQDQNKFYAGELLAILLQAGTSDESRDRCARFGKVDGIDALLQALSPLRKHASHDSEAREYFENLFDALCAVLTVPPNKARFCEAEGIELMCLIMKNKGFSRMSALKVASYASTGVHGVQNCERFVENAGLKYLFSTLMRGSGSERGGEVTTQEEGHMLELIAALLNNLASESMERIRLISKFVEGDYEKLDRLVEIRSAAKSRIRTIEASIARQQHANPPPADVAEQEERDVEAYIQRLDNGLFVLQLTDYILAWLIMEDDGIQAHVQLLLDRSEDDEADAVRVQTNGAAPSTSDAVVSPFRSIIATLQEYYVNVGEDVLVAEPGKPGEEPLSLRDVIVQLVNYLLGL